MDQVRPAARRYPNRGLAAPDVQNAFGDVSWLDALTVCNQSARKLLPILACMWASGTLSLWLQDADGGAWHSILVYGGLFQGGCEGHPCFCIIIAAVWIRVTADGRITASLHVILALFFHVDDIVVQAPIEVMDALLDAFEHALAAHHFVLKRAKCKLHIPAAASSDCTHWPDLALKLEGRI